MQTKKEVQGQSIDKTSLERLTALIGELRKAQDAVGAAEIALAKAKAYELKLNQETVPGLMQELGIKKLTMDDGSTIEMKPDVSASINDSNRLEAFDWLEKNGHSGIIKVAVTTEYSKGQYDEATELYKELMQRGVSVGFDQSVNAQTLKAFLREQLRNGVPVPLAVFNAQSYFWTKVTDPKSK